MLCTHRPAAASIACRWPRSAVFVHLHDIDWPSTCSAVIQFLFI
jgi:hypothetical protein